MKFNPGPPPKIESTCQVTEPPAPPPPEPSMYLTGGYNSPDFKDGRLKGTLDRYDVATDSWTTIDAAMSEPRYFSMVAVVDNKLYVIGGYKFNSSTVSRNYGRVELASVERFDPVAETWETVASMNM